MHLCHTSDTFVMQSFYFHTYFLPLLVSSTLLITDSFFVSHLLFLSLFLTQFFFSADLLLLSGFFICSYLFYHTYLNKFACFHHFARKNIPITLTIPSVMGTVSQIPVIPPTDAKTNAIGTIKTIPRRMEIH